MPDDTISNSLFKNLLIASTNDEYCVQTAKKEFSDILKMAYLELPPYTGHINIDSGFGRWNDILKIVLNS